MRFLTITVIALIALLTACASAQEGGSPGDDLSTAETLLGYQDTILPLPVLTEPGDVLYVDPIWAIEVVEILADGRLVAGKPSYVLLDYLNVEPVTAQGGTFIYKVRSDSLLFGQFTPDGLGYSLVEYSVPEDAKVLEIRYRLVPHESDPEPRIYTLTARRVG
ncbi:hypothetical protein [Pelagibius marinus]|uniref:hypothetical protein n=1 Tax=Pelagibius marinus TaxID=2762760 RepID=UPI001872A53D|nr:hypothetical protein [Pelagibius marinus]